MAVTPEQREGAFQEADPVVQELYDSVESGRTFRAIFQKHNLPPEYYKAYITVVSNVVLGLEGSTELSTQFQGDLSLDGERADELAADVRAFIDPVLEGGQSMDTNPTTSVPPAQNTETLPASAPPLEDTPVVQPLRTMEQDMDRIHGYGAYRKLYPDTQATSETTEAPATPQAAATSQPTAAEENVVVATSQDDTLAARIPPREGSSA